MLTVYHGSTCCVEQPLAGVCRPNLDFGIGFYVTSLEEQATRWALRTADLRHQTEAWLNTYLLDIDVCHAAPYRCRYFENYNADWLDFVVSCRQGGVLWQDYDIIEGGIADDRVIRTIDLYIQRCTRSWWCIKGWICQCMKRCEFYFSLKNLASRS